MADPLVPPDQPKPPTGEEPLRVVRAWASRKRRVLELRAERESCEWMEPSEMFGEDATGWPGVPECFATTQPPPVRQWCEPCQRNQARFLLMRWLRRKVWRDQGRMLKLFAPAHHAAQAKETR